MAEYTVILADHSVHRNVDVTRALKVEGGFPEDAAGNAETALASEIWNRRYPDRGQPETHPDEFSDEDWIACMESVSTLAVIVGHPRVFVEDDIYDPRLAEAMKLSDSQEKKLAMFKQGRYLKAPGLNHSGRQIGVRSQPSQNDLEALVNAGYIKVTPEGDYANGEITVL